MAPSSIASDRDTKPFVPFAFADPSVAALREEIRALQREIGGIRAEHSTFQGGMTNLRKDLKRVEGSGKESLVSLDNQLTAKLYRMEDRLETEVKRVQADMNGRMERIQAGWARMKDSFSAFSNVLDNNTARPGSSTGFGGSSNPGARSKSEEPSRNRREKNQRPPASSKAMKARKGERGFCERCGKNLSMGYMRKHLLFVCH